MAPLDTLPSPTLSGIEHVINFDKTINLKINQATDAIIETKRIKVFQYQADAEDGICTWGTVDDFGLFETRREATVACYGEVWADEDTNIL